MSDPKIKDFLKDIPFSLSFRLILISTAKNNEGFVIITFVY